jgi:hypothetical protein
MTGDVTEGGPTEDEAGQVERWKTGVLDVDGKAGVVCWSCFWKTDPDLWISNECWDALSPLVPSSSLPSLFVSHDMMWDPTNYPWPLADQK